MPQYPYYSSPYSPSFSPYGVPPQPTINQSSNQMPTPQNSNNGIVWVQGEAGAKSYLVGAGNSVLLMDSEQSRFYIKSTDPSGMPMPLRVFEYTEISSGNAHRNVAQANPNNDYVTHEELEQRLKEIEVKPASKKGVKNDAESSV